MLSRLMSGSKVRATGAATLTVIVVGLLFVPGLNRPGRAEDPSGAAPKVNLDIALQVTDDGTRGIFLLRNESDEEFVTTPPRTNYNRMIVTLPDGKVVEDYVLGRNIPSVVVKPGEQATWPMEISESRHFRKPGVYRIQWKIGELRSPETLVVREEPDAKAPEKASQPK